MTTDIPRSLLGMMLVLVLASTLSVHAPIGYSWVAKKSMPTARSHLSAVAADGYVFAMGGNGAQPAIGTNERYDPGSDTWSTRSSIATGGRADFGLTVLNDKIYMAGGVDASGTCSKSMEEYDPVADTWTSRAPMSVARAGLTLVTAAGLVFAIGGHCIDSTHNEPSLDIVERYNPADNTWLNKTSMPVSLNRVFGMTIGQPFTGYTVYVIGGDLPTVSTYNPILDSWNSLPGLNSTRQDVTVYAATVISSLNSTIEMVGAVSSLVGGFSGNETIEYDTASNSWRNETANPFSGQYSALASVGGAVYAMGGANLAPGQIPLAYNEAYQPPNTPRPVPGGIWGLVLPLVGVGVAGVLMIGVAVRMKRRARPSKKNPGTKK